MPRKAIYWRNPEIHRAESQKRKNYRRALGLSAFEHLSPVAQAKRRAAASQWTRTHRAANRKAQLKYRRKLQRLFGACTERSMWLHSQLRAEEDVKKRKAAIALLPRKLVEDRQRMHLVSCRQMVRRRYLKTWGVVLLRRNSKLQRPLQFIRGSRRGIICLL